MSVFIFTQNDLMIQCSILYSTWCFYHAFKLFRQPDPVLIVGIENSGKWFKFNDRLMSGTAKGEFNENKDATLKLDVSYYRWMCL